MPLPSPCPDAIVVAMLLRLFLLLMLPVALHAGEEDAIGRLNTAGYRTTEMCTATLIAPALILTAAHCVTRPEDGYLKRVDDMVFVAGWDGADHTGAARIKEVHVHPQAYAEGRFDIRHDLALAELTEPLTPAPLTFGNGTLPGPLTLMGYMRSRPHRLTITPYCYGEAVSGLWRIGCRVEPGQSGGPVILGEGQARRVVAVIVAVTEEQALVVPVDGWLRQQFAASR
ncbi:trypsin-like serine peptidase [Antarctobacter jejuensis]|uniref:trypsin-like serine peptidase n=1 Tax=Antarctobacter jejuensis TaxID=1439938 RepID=UPI003FD6484D